MKSRFGAVAENFRLTENMHEAINIKGPVLLSYYNAISSILSCDFRPPIVISDYLRVISNVFVRLSQEKTLWKK